MARKHKWPMGSPRGESGARSRASMTLSEAVQDQMLRRARLPRVFVDRARCDGCGSCVTVCPVEAIVVEAVARIDPVACIACCQCVMICPQEAIVLETFNRVAARQGAR